MTDHEINMRGGDEIFRYSSVSSSSSTTMHPRALSFIALIAAAAAQQLGGDNLRFGGEGASTSLSSYGNLEQPFYKSSDGAW